jgi:hypothetical protein
MGLTKIETQPVIHFHKLRGYFIFIKQKKNKTSFEEYVCLFGCLGTLLGPHTRSGNPQAGSFQRNPKR